MTKIKIIALFGESGVGKDTIQHWLLQNLNNSNKIIHYTTRPKREKEVNGQDYLFISKFDFYNFYNADKIISPTKYNDWCYGIAKDSIREDSINIGVFNLNDIQNLLPNPDYSILPIRITVNDKSKLLRALMREKEPDCYEICRRFMSDREDFKNIPFLYSEYKNTHKNFSQILNLLPIGWLDKKE